MSDTPNPPKTKTKKNILAASSLQTLVAEFTEIRSIPNKMNVFNIKEMAVVPGLT